MLRSTRFSRGLTIANLNGAVKAADYAVRGIVADTADKLKAEGKEIIYCNIGNPQQLGQKPLTFPREVLALVSAPHLLSKPIGDLERLFAKDSITRAKTILEAIGGKAGGGTGAYTHSLGYQFVRDNIAAFIEARDNRNSGKQLGPTTGHIFLSNGASPAVQYALTMLISGSSDSILIPYPQYPLYTATISLLGGQVAPYVLDEARGWSMTAEDLIHSYDAAKKSGTNPRGLVIINPGNPTGQLLSVDVMQDIIKFCASKDIVLMADEVYQENVYTTKKKFHSFREVMLSMGEPYSKVQLISFHTTSKGLIGECGRRGGYMHMMNFSEEVFGQFLKRASIDLCPNVAGQLMCDLMVKEPAVGDASYASHEAEKKAIFDSLQRRALVLVDELNRTKGIQCNEIEGAMYAFPTLHFPQRLIDEAASKKQSPDLLWCLKLLNETGIVCVPGSGFRQKEGTFHARLTILPPQVETVAKAIGDFHRSL